jgi:hypothetical protein
MINEIEEEDKEKETSYDGAYNNIVPLSYMIRLQNALSCCGAG